MGACTAVQLAPPVRALDSRFLLEIFRAKEE
jgi:hypothetical protein